MDYQGTIYSREADLVSDNKNTANLLTEKFFNDKFSLGRDYFVDDCIKKIYDFRLGLTEEHKELDDYAMLLSHRLKKPGVEIIDIYDIFKEEKMDWQERSEVFAELRNQILKFCTAVLHIGENFDEQLDKELEKLTVELMEYTSTKNTDKFLPIMNGL